MAGCPVYVRLSHTDADGLGGKGTSALIKQTRQFIREAISDALEQGQLLQSKEGEPSPMPRDDESLWEYLHRKVSGLRSRHTRTGRARFGLRSVRRNLHAWPQ